MLIDLITFEKIMNTCLIVESGIVALAGIIHNRQLVTNKDKKHQFSDYIRITVNAPHMKGYLDAYRFLIYFISTFILCCLAYFIFINTLRYGFVFCGIVAFIEMYLIHRAARTEKAYISFIERVMLEESLEEFKRSKRRREE